MAAMFTNLSWWLWAGKEKKSPTLNPSLDLREVENVKHSTGKGVKLRSESRRVKKKWSSREERRIDKEFDVVLVPSDGGCCLSVSESDGSDWSIGWMEPLAPDFQSNDDIDGSFAVLVPCYGHGQKETVDSSKNQLSTAIGNGHSAERNGYLEQWLSSLQKN